MDTDGKRTQPTLGLGVGDAVLQDSRFSATLRYVTKSRWDNEKRGRIAPPFGKLFWQSLLASSVHILRKNRTIRDSG